MPATLILYLMALRPKAKPKSRCRFCAVTMLF